MKFNFFVFLFLFGAICQTLAFSTTPCTPINFLCVANLAFLISMVIHYVIKKLIYELALVAKDILPK